MQPLAQPPRKDDGRFDDWMYKLWKRISATAGVAWILIDKTGANLTDIPTRNHNDLQNMQGGNGTTEEYHLTSAQHGLFTSGTATQVLHGSATLPTWGAIDLTNDVTGALPIGNGGTGQTSAQNAINALTNVAGATDEYVLTKDTATGNAIFKVAVGGGGDIATAFALSFMRI